MLEYEMLKLYQEGQLGFVLLRKCDHFLKKVSWEPCCSRNVSANQPNYLCLPVCDKKMSTFSWEPPVSDEKVSVTKNEHFFHFVSVCLS